MISMTSSAGNDSSVNLAKVDNTMPAGRWQFDGDVTDAFDDMLQRSIPQYDMMRDVVFQMGQKYVQRGTDIVDLGASRGEAIAPFIDRFGASNRYTLIEVSKPMLASLKERFRLLEQNPPGLVKIRDMDLRHEYPPVAASLTLCVLTLQFTPIEYRLQILNRIYEHTLAEGAVIFVEKVLGNSAQLDEHMVDIYYRLKAQNGYSDEAIARKRAALEGVLVPVTADMNETFFKSAGFREVDCIWRWFNFSAWIAVKAG
jgi:tRNA (cmo5U34)-methyltransferase